MYEKIHQNTKGYKEYDAIWTVTPQNIKWTVQTLLYQVEQKILLFIKGCKYM